MKRRPPVEGPLSYGRAGDIRDPEAGPSTPTPPGEEWGWRLGRGVFALVAVAAGLVIGAVGLWLWSSYLPVGVVDLSLPGGARSETLTDVSRALDAYGTAWTVLGLASVAWLGLALVSSPASRRILATGALVALAGGALMAWTAPSLAWDDVVVASVVPGEPGGLLVGGDVQHYVVAGEEISSGTYEALLVGHLLGASLVVIGLLSGGLLTRARRRHPDDGTLIVRP